MTLSAEPLITPSPSTSTSRAHLLAKRHVYICGDQTLSWRPEWYTAHFFTDPASRASYDSAASRGPVQPPTGVFQEVPECAGILRRLASAASSAVTDTRSASADQVETEAASDSEAASRSRGTTLEIVTTRMASTLTSDGLTIATTLRRVTTLTPTPTPTPTSSTTLSSLSAPSSSSTGGQTLSKTFSLTSTASSRIPTASEAFQGANTNTCAGDWDWQGWGAVSNLGAGVIIGGLLWGLWFLMKKRHPQFSAPRNWFVPPESRPSKPWSIVTFLLPFLHLPSASNETSTASSSPLHILFAALKMAAFVSLLALAAVLPIIMAGVPCLRQTAPLNALGGRLGALTDMSLLRLLDALDPSPDSTATTNTLRLMFSTRSLSSTIAPAIESARTRLIVILVLLAVLAVGGGLFIVARTYAWLARAKKHFEETICGGMEMAFVAARDAEGWKGMSEEGLRRALKEWTGRMVGDEGKKEMDVVGVFAIPADTSELITKVKDREDVLMQLELAEMNYITSFKLTHTQSTGDLVQPLWWAEVDQPSDGSHQPSPNRNTPPTDFVAPRLFYKVGSVAKPHSEEKLDIPVPSPTRTRTQTSSKSPNVAETRFHEINRDSAMYGGRFEIGQRIKMDEQGNYVPDPSPDSDDTHGTLSITPETMEESGEYYTADDGRNRGEFSELPRSGEGEGGGEPSEAPRQSAEDPQSVLASTSISTEDPVIPRMSPRPRQSVSRKPSLGTIASAHRHAGPPSALAHQYHAIVYSRARFKELNGEIERLQRTALASIAKGDGDVRGWIVVGRRVGRLPAAQCVEGMTREDILWDHAGEKVGAVAFWLKVTCLGIALGALMVPFVGLTVATTPGFSHYLPGLKPLADSDGFGSGVVQALVPALVLSTAVGLAIWATEGFSRDVNCISRQRQQKLAYKATFYILLFVCVLCMLLVASLEYAVGGFERDVQAARTVGDGAVFSTWFVFVLLLNIAFVVPAIYLLQPRRLLKYLKSRRAALTPRQKFRVLRPPSYSPTFALAPCILGVMYASTLLFIFPLLSIPILLLLYLSFVANRHMAEYVFVNAAYGELGLGLWTMRRFGWTLALQPALYGLLMLSRNEWALGGVSLGVALVAVVLSEGLTAFRYRRASLSSDTRRALDELKTIMRHPSSTNLTTGRASPNSHSHSHSYSGGSRNSLHSDLSLLNRVTALLPSYARLPDTCPVPLKTERIDDLHSAERASYANPVLVNAGLSAPHTLFSEDSDPAKGLIYPPEMMDGPPVIWLHRDANGLAYEEVGDLDRFHGLRAIVDPGLPGDRLGRRSGVSASAERRGTDRTASRTRMSVRRKGKEKETVKEKREGEVDRPLLDS